MTEWPRRRGLARGGALFSVTQNRLAVAVLLQQFCVTPLTPSALSILISYADSY